jgi:hypothetical protein
MLYVLRYTDLMPGPEISKISSFQGVTLETKDRRPGRNWQTANRTTGLGVVSLEEKTMELLGWVVQGCRPSRAASWAAPSASAWRGSSQRTELLLVATDGNDTSAILSYSLLASTNAGPSLARLTAALMALMAKPATAVVAVIPRAVSTNFLDSFILTVAPSLSLATIQLGASA